MNIKKNGKVINLTESDLKRIVNHTLNEASVSDIKIWVGSGENEGKIVVNKKGKNYIYLLEAYKNLIWWDIVVSKISVIDKFIKYFHPMSNKLLKSPLSYKSIDKIKKYIGNSEINLGTTKEGDELRLTKIS